MRDTLGFVGMDSSAFSGHNLARDSLATPNSNTPSTGANRPVPDTSGTLAAERAAMPYLERYNSPEVGAYAGTGALAQWVASVRPGSVPTESGVESHPKGGGDPIGSTKDTSAAGSRWQKHGHGHFCADSCAASDWGEVHVNEVELSANEDDSSTTGDGSSSKEGAGSEASWTRGRGCGPGSEWNGLDATLDSRYTHDFNNTAASSTFFGTDSPSHRARDSIFLGNHSQGEDIPRGTINGTGSIWQTPPPYHQDRPGQAQAGENGAGDGDTMS